jgi:hypothetical protein
VSVATEPRPLSNWEELRAEAIAGSFGATLRITALPRLEWLEVSQLLLCTIRDALFCSAHV